MVETLLAKAREYLPDDKIDVIERAYRFAEDAHDRQVRLSGEPFIQHPLQTALFLADLRLDANALAGALLHDVIEDCDVGIEEVEAGFGPEVAKLVDGVTKLTKTEVMASEPSTLRESGSDYGLAKAATLRKMLTAMAEDVRVVLIKLADRLHNMRTLSPLPAERRQAIAQETLDIYAPLAHRLGIWDIKWRLEDLAFQQLDPDSYRRISDLLNAKRAEREEYIERIRGILQGELERVGLTAEVTGRPKHFYSIHKKTARYAADNKEVGEIFDLFALRVLVDDVQDCYSTLGVVHSRWHPLPGQFDDYIANPKDNLYQSLHSSVLCEGAAAVEVQIRTHEMHRVAEYGVAAHWLYKEGRGPDASFDDKMTWLGQLIDWQREVGGAEEFVESFKADVFQNQVFVYTPKGELKELPAGSTAVDFAYRVHTDVGHRCIGAKVNGKLVPLHYQLQNGDTVQILTSRTVLGPTLEWLNPNLRYVKTGSAREKIRQWFNRQERKTNIEAGAAIFEKQVRRLSKTIDEAKMTELLGLDSTEAFLAGLGSGTVTMSQVVNSLSSREETSPIEEVESPSTTSGPATGLKVLGVGDLATRWARCCDPVPGDGIIGYITRNRGVTVHTQVCSNIRSENETERLIPVWWDKAETLYPVRVEVKAWDRVGLLRDITSRVSEERVNIASCVSEEFDDISVVSLTIYINGIDQLDRLFSRLEGIEGCISVLRATS